MESVRRQLLTNPRETANAFSVLMFWWTVGMFKKGYRKIFELTDLYQPLKVDRSDNLGDRLDKRWTKQLNKKNGRPSLIMAIVSTFWREYTWLGVVSVINDVGIRLAQPLLLGRLLMYFRVNPTVTYEEALGYAAGIVILSGLGAIVVNQYLFGGFYNGMKVRVAVCSVIYRKALRLSQTALGETAVGKIVNLLSNDVNRFDLVSMFIHSMWTAPLMSIVIGYLLYIEVKWAGIIGIAIVFIVVPIQSFTGKLSSIFRLQTALRTDERVRFMDEIISGVQVIKMYAWEVPFTKLIEFARKMELKIVRRNSYVRALYMTFLLFTTRMALFCTMLSVVLLYGSDQLTASKVFVVSSYFNIVSQTMSQMFVRGVAEIAEALVSFRRLQNFLEYEEKDGADLAVVLGLNTNGTDDKPKSPPASKLQPDEAVVITDLTARWIPLSKLESRVLEQQQMAEKNGTPTSNGKPGDDDNVTWKQPTLHKINVNIKKGQLIGIVGPVGSGKTSLLQALLSEIPQEAGSVAVCGDVSYASQEPWVFAGTARQNILFGQEMERERYDAVIKACSLVKDFEQFEAADQTQIGERGTSLSGGQKARVNLARAVYREADVYLLDDPLSAVDAHVGKHLFNECIGPKGRLARSRATRILVTHQVHFLKDADWVIVMRDGEIEVQGAPSELSKSGIDFATLLESDDPVKKNEDPASLRRLSRSMSQTSVRSGKSDSSDNEITEQANGVEQLQQLEATSKGRVKGSVGGAYLMSGANICVILVLFALFLMTQLLASGADYWVSFWTRQEEARVANALIEIVTVSSAVIDTRIVQEYLPLINESQFIDMTETALTSSRDFVFIDSVTGLLTTEACIYIHGTLVVAVFVIGLIRSVSFYTICVRASQKLHDNMFKGVISTTMRFFDTNPGGRILNRFSKDMGAADEFLPKAVLDASQIILNMVGAIVVTSIVNPYFLILVAVLGVVFIYLRKIYLKTSKNIKRLEGTTRSPVFTHISATLNGLSTIRAFGAQNVLVEEFDNHQDLHTSCWYMFISTSSAFGLVLDLLALVFIAVITYTFLLLDGDVLGDQVGLAITQAMSLTTMLQWGIRQSAEVANQLMSVERILEYRDLEPETAPPKPKALEPSWPADGKIEFRSVVYRYFAEADPVLKGLSFVVHPMEKIGIVGRTGAGKSSLISAIFRLAVIEGEIVVDGVDTAEISLDKLRSKISIIPQDPVLFSGTIRRNLDPFEEFADANIWQALGDVELKDIASGPLGLQSSVMSGGSNFSVGQRQLICLARAILRNNRILVLDEATANVDPHTDGLIQKTIRAKFSECTVLTVAHRLHTIMDSDRVLVMDTGIAAEFSSPHELLQQGRGIFYEMVHTLGPQETERLKQAAKDKFESTQKLA